MTEVSLLCRSIAIIFIFSWLLMLLCTLTFVIGAPAEAVLCKNIRDRTVIRTVRPARSQG